MNIAIMAHPERREQAESLASRYNAWITWDHHNSRWDTGRRAWWSLTSSPHEYSLVLQDDAIPARGFLSGLPNMLAHVPEDCPVVLYTGKTYRWRGTFDKIPRKTSFLVMDRIWWGVGIILPTRLIEPAIHVGDQIAVAGHDQYDHMLGAYFHRNGIPVYYTWPSIVDHRKGPSLINGRTGRRAAHQTATVPVARVRWSGRQEKVEAPTLAKAAFLAKGK